MDFKNEFSWSKSRDEVFCECKRKYYFNHYGFWDGWKADAPQRVRELYILKNLSTRHIWIGKVVHDIIKDFLLCYKAGKKLSLPQLIYRLRKRLEDGLKESISKAYKINPKYKVGLMEHEYEMGITQEEWDELFKYAERCITNFFNSDILKEIKNINTNKWVIIESSLELDPRKPQNFDFEGNNICLKIDFAIKNDDNKIILYDWKTGKERDVEMDIQLTCYALYIIQKWNLNPEDITIKKFNVALDKEDEFKVTTEVIECIKNYMRKSIEDMKNILKDKENNIAEEDNSPKTTNVKTCLRCNFKKVCDLV